MERFIDPTASVGDGTTVGRFTVIESSAVVGAGCVIGHNVVIHAGTVVGDNVRIDDGAVLGDGDHLVVLDDESAVESARKGVSVAMSSKMSTVLDITYNDRVPLRAQEFNNALAEAYITQSIYKKTREASKTLSFIDVQLDKINENLKNSAVKLENFKKDTSTVSLDAKAQSVMGRLSEAEGRLAMIDIEVGLLNNLYTQVQSGKNLETISVSGLTPGTGESGSGAQALTGVVSDLQQAVMKLKTLRVDYTEQYTEVIKVRRQVEQMKKNIIDMIKKVRDK